MEPTRTPWWFGNDETVNDDGELTSHEASGGAYHNPD
jgi:hypothetical protein